MTAEEKERGHQLHVSQQKAAEVQLSDSWERDETGDRVFGSDQEGDGNSCEGEGSMLLWGMQHPDLSMF